MKNVEVKFPLIEDIKMDVAKKFGMIQPGSSDTQAVRAVFVIDPQAVVRCILYYPASTGRNFEEIKRIIIAMQKSDAEGIATGLLAAGRRRHRPAAGLIGMPKADGFHGGRYLLPRWFSASRRQI